jgi:hypothetical protein
MKKSSHSYWLFLLVSMFGAFLTAAVFVIVIQLSLPPTDLAYHQGISKTFSDPFVRDIASFVAFWCGLLASPLLFFCLRQRKLAVALPIIFGSVLVAVSISTPISPLLGLFCAVAALVGSCIICTQIQVTSLESSHDAT